MQQKRDNYTANSLSPFHSIPFHSSWWSIVGTHDKLLVALVGGPIHPPQPPLIHVFQHNQTQTQAKTPETISILFIYLLV